MDQRTWDRIAGLFEQAIALPGPDRDHFVQRSAGDDAGVRDAVLRMLRHDASDQVLDRSVDVVAAALFDADHDDPALGAGDRVGDYVIVGVLGRGGMGVVYRARDTRLERLAALKFLPSSAVASGSAARVEAEARAASALDHPNIATIYHVGTSADGRPYIAMAHYDGQTLAERLERGPLAPREAVRIAATVAGGLAVAHQRGIVHRDVKPANIFLTDGGQVKLLDFGIAAAAGSASYGATFGTPLYMSPEQASATAPHPKSDVWSLGTVLYEMLAGHPPFAADSTATLRALKSGELPPLPSRPGLTNALRGVVSRALSRDPSQRFADAGAMQRALEQILDAPSTAVVWSRLSTPVRAGMGLGAVALITAAWFSTAQWRARARQGSAGPPPRITVLDLRLVAPDTADADLAVGLSEEINSRLSRLSTIRLKRRTSDGFTPDSAISDPIALGRRLQVEYLVEGSLQRTDTQRSVAIRLTKTDDGLQIWADDFEAPDAELPALPQRIATEVASRIDGRLSRGAVSAVDRPLTADAQAFVHYMRGNTFLARRTPLMVEQAIDQYRLAVERDSSFAAAHARIAYGYALFLDWGWRFRRMSREQLLREGRALANAALGRDSTTADAWLAHAYLLALQDPVRFRGALVAFERAIQLDSSSVEAQYQYGQSLMALGRWEEARTAYRRAIALEPERALTYVSLAAIEAREGHAATARRLLDSALLVEPGASYARTARVALRLHEGDLRGAQEDAETAVRTTQGYAVPPRSRLAIVLARSGKMAEANREVAAAISAMADQVNPSPTDALFLGTALIATGRSDEALSLLERTRPRGAWLWFYSTSADFDAIRSNPRFIRVLNEARPQSTTSPG